MKIAMFLDAFPVWSETFILNQIAGLIDRGHDVRIFTRHRSRLDTNHAIIDDYKLMERVHYFGSSRTPSRFARIKKIAQLFLDHSNFIRPEAWKLAWKIVRGHGRDSSWNILSMMNIALPVLGEEPYDVIHCQFGHFGPMVLYLKQIGAIDGRLITSFRGHDATQYAKIGSGKYDALFEKGDLFLPVSEAIGKRLVELGCNKNKIKVLHSGIDCAKFEFRERLHKKNSPTRIISVARLVEMKGIGYAIEAIARISQSRRHVVYSVIGDGVLRSDLERLIEDLGVTEQVQLLGWKTHEEVSRLLQGAHILVAPSVTATRGETEGIPNAAKEAMAMGLPVVSTLHGGIPELVENGVSGFLVPERDVGALTERLTYLIDHPESWPALGRAGRRHIEAEFDSNLLNDRLVQLYSGTCG